MENRTIEIKWGIIFTLAMLCWTLLERLVGLHDERIDQHSFYSAFFSIVAIGIYIFALRDKKKNYYHGLMSWKEGFLSGLMITVVILLLSPIAQYLIRSVVSPEFFPNMIRHSIDAGLMTREQAEEYFGLKNYILQSALFALFSGITTSAIVAFIFRSRDQALST